MPGGLRFEWIAKSGYAARGVVFLLVAGLALFSGVADSAPDTKPALAQLLQQPFGRVWVGLIGICLLGFVVWRLAQSLGDADGHGTSPKALAVRAALLGSAVTYFGLAGYAIAHAVFSQGDSGGSGEKGLAGWLMSQPYGGYLAMIVGAGFLAGGGITIVKGITRRFKRYLRLSGGTGLTELVCVYGLVARGLVFAIIGGFFVYAGFRVEPEQAGGMSDALQWVRQLPFGALLYIAVALGLGAFGIYNLVEARYRIVRSPDMALVKRMI